jgi:trk system potassium uptake protein TrkH
MKGPARQAVRQRVRRALGLTPQSLLVSGFAGLILVGTAMLMLPVSLAAGRLSLVDALFTATSAVCVTGLVVVDTGTQFSVPGQVVILLLIQAGGLGVMAFAALAFDLLGRRLSLRARSAFNETFFQADVAAGFHRQLVRIVKIVAVLEALGAAALFVGFLEEHSVGRAAYSAVFHSVSAFCNAGFSLYEDSLVGVRGNLLVMLPIALLIIAGGLGQPVLLEILRWARTRGTSEGRPGGLGLHARVVLWSSLVLVAGGAVLLWLTGMTPMEGSFGACTAGALFQSVTARTAGFNSVDIGALPLASALLLCVLMFIGGSPGSCAGGIKTTTAVLWMAQLTARLRGRKWPTILGRHIPGELVRRASSLVGLALLWNVVGVLLLAVTEADGAVSLRDLLFEQISAFGTVGLSTGLTPLLSVPGRLWIILTMFVGRVGPLTLAVWAFEHRSPGVKLPEGRVMIG